MKTLGNGWMVGLIALGACGGGTTTPDAPVTVADMTMAAPVDMAMVQTPMDLAMTPDDLTVIATQDLKQPSPDLVAAAPPVFTYVGDINGDILEITVDHGANTVSGVDTTTPFVFTGPVTLLPSGFLRVIVTAGCDGAGCTPTNKGSTKVTIGTILHAIEAPGTVLVIHSDKDANAYGLVARGDCSSLFTTYNYVMTGFPSTFDPINSTTFGVVTLGGSASAVTIASMGSTLGGSTKSDPSPPPASCNKGEMIFSAGSSLLTIQASATGGLFVSGAGDKTSPNGAVGFKQNSLALADLENKTYSGFAFSDTTNAISVTFGGSAAGTSKIFSDVDNNVLSTDMTTFSTVTLSGISSGLASGTFTGVVTTGSFRATTMSVGGQTVMVLAGAQAQIGADAGAHSTGFNAILVSH